MVIRSAAKMRLGKESKWKERCPRLHVSQSRIVSLAALVASQFRSLTRSLLLLEDRVETALPLGKTVTRMSIAPSRKRVSVFHAVVSRWQLVSSHLCRRVRGICQRQSSRGKTWRV